MPPPGHASHGHGALQPAAGPAVVLAGRLVDDGGVVVDLDLCGPKIDIYYFTLPGSIDSIEITGWDCMPHEICLEKIKDVPKKFINGSQIGDIEHLP